MHIVVAWAPKEWASENPSVNRMPEGKATGSRVESAARAFKSYRNQDLSSSKMSRDADRDEVMVIYPALGKRETGRSAPV